MENEDALSALSALAHEARLDIFRLLVRAGHDGLPAGEVAERLDARQNTTSTNLAILARAGLVASRREGRSVIYAADFDAMRGLVGFLMKDCCAGAPERVDPLLSAIQPCEGEDSCPVSTSP
ncbi:transcriptional regulator [Marinicauda salina]|uniref:Transcriptional regulator n=1 Tax=Marinicauda salina TaxID=2135793 RepID=A0A2U2BSE5_9PROT|nr:metalloregulator ArsR/SmtB family transcription factor [Marinicauda salina]PWE16945.1 transcriptional regulator [Marinicauda salina]